MESPYEFEEELRELEKAGVLEVQQTRNGRKINFTDEGEALTELKIACDTDMQLFLFKMMWEEKYSHTDDGIKRLFQIAHKLRENPGVNILRTLEANQEKIQGIEFAEGYLPEEIVQQFDPDSKKETGDTQ